VTPGTDTLPAKEYKGSICAGDMLRGFDVYRAGVCNRVACSTTG